MKLFCKNFLCLPILVMVFSTCAQNTSPSQVTIIDAEELLKMQSDGVKVVDVRTPEEFGQGKIPGAVNVPLSGSFANSMTKFEKDRPVIVYCRSGRRSTIASEQLEQAGYTAIFNYQGSFNDWTAKKKPVE